jgi:hypothetical protein
LDYIGSTVYVEDAEDSNWEPVKEVFDFPLDYIGSTVYVEEEGDNNWEPVLEPINHPTEYHVSPIDTTAEVEAVTIETHLSASQYIKSPSDTGESGRSSPATVETRPSLEITANSVLAAEVHTATKETVPHAPPPGKELFPEVAAVTLRHVEPNKPPVMELDL